MLSGIIVSERYVAEAYPLLFDRNSTRCSFLESVRFMCHFFFWGELKGVSWNLCGIQLDFLRDREFQLKSLAGCFQLGMNNTFHSCSVRYLSRDVFCFSFRDWNRTRRVKRFNSVQFASGNFSRLFQILSLLFFSFSFCY